MTNDFPNIRKWLPSLLVVPSLSLNESDGNVAAVVRASDLEAALESGVVRYRCKTLNTPWFDEPFPAANIESLCLDQPIVRECKRELSESEVRNVTADFAKGVITYTEMIEKLFGKRE